MPKQWIDYGRGSSTAAQDEGQVSEDLVASAFQFFSRLAAVFAEEVGGFELFVKDGPI